MVTLNQRISLLETAYKNVPNVPEYDLTFLTAEELIHFQAMKLRCKSLPIVNGKHDLSGLNNTELREMIVLLEKVYRMPRGKIIDADEFEIRK